MITRFVTGDKVRRAVALPKRFTCVPFKTRGRAKKIIALLIVAATLNVGGAVASPTIRVQPTGLMRTGGIVTVDGSRANPGQTLFSGSTITTAKESWSSINLDNSVRLNLGEATVLNLEFAHARVVGSVGNGEIAGYVPAGIRAEVKTADASIVTNPAQPATFVIHTEACNTKVSVESGQLEVLSWNRVHSVGAGQSFSTGDSSPPMPQQNLSQGKRIGLIVGIGATIGVLFIAFHGTTQKVPDDRPGSVCVPSGNSGC